MSVYNLTNQYFSSVVLSEKTTNKYIASKWYRPSEWLTLPTINQTEQKFVALHAIRSESNFVSLVVSGAYTVNWGDGIIENFASNATAYHQYEFTSSVFDGTDTSYGYRQAIVIITPSGSSNFNKLDLNIKHNQTNLNRYQTGWLDICLSAPSMSSLILGDGTTINARNSSLEQFTFFGINNITSMVGAFAGLYGLKRVFISDTSKITSMQEMFEDCYNLLDVSLFNTNKVTNTNSMFSNCRSLEKIPLFDISKVTNMNSMFNGCYNLKQIPKLNTSSSNGMSSLFNSCYSLEEVPILNTSNVTDMSNMFFNCLNLKYVPLFDTSKVTNMNSMFSNCSSLSYVPLFDMSKVTSATNMFNECSSLKSIPTFDTSKITSMNTFFQNCFSLEEVPSLNASASTSFTTFVNVPSLSKSLLYNVSRTISYANAKLSKNALETIFDNLISASAASQTITITGNWGLGTTYTPSGSIVANSKIVTGITTSSLQVGMLVRGAGVTGSVPVLIVSNSQTFTRTSHGIPDYTAVSFTSSFGNLQSSTVFYVTQSTADTFSLTSTLTGSIFVPNTNATGSMRYPCYIESIGTGTITLTAPAHSTANSSSLSIRLLDTTKAFLKGFTVTG